MMDTDWQEPCHPFWKAIAAAGEGTFHNIEAEKWRPWAALWDAPQQALCPCPLFEYWEEETGQVGQKKPLLLWQGGIDSQELTGNDKRQKQPPLTLFQAGCPQLWVLWEMAREMRIKCKKLLGESKGDTSQNWAPAQSPIEQTKQSIQSVLQQQQQQTTTAT